MKIYPKHSENGQGQEDSWKISNWDPRTKAIMMELSMKMYLISRKLNRKYSQLS